MNPPRTAVVEEELIPQASSRKWTNVDGYLYSHTVSGDVMLTPHNWEAGFELKSLSSGSRHVYTADWDDRTTEKVDQTNLKAFKSSPDRGPQAPDSGFSLHRGSFELEARAIHQLGARDRRMG
ncbi:hypothetical protein MASR2M17_01750 [Aminivibrio sp.]